jgi:hypothetical protein
MRLMSATLALLAVLSGSSALADPAGKYDVLGTNPDKSGEYTGTVKVTRNGDTYKVIWTIGDSQTVGVGIGGHMVGEGYSMGPASEEDTILSVAYSSGNTVGTALYYEGPDGVWRGAWAYDGAGRSATENWTPKAGKKKIVVRALKTEKAISTPKPVMAGPKS